MISDSIKFEYECRIRDYYASKLQTFKPRQLLIGTEKTYSNDSMVRVDMRTVDENQVLREWEFKLAADYDAIGQILTYVAQSRVQTNFKRKVIGVIAAFEFRKEITDAIEILNLGIEIVHLPIWIAKAGNIPTSCFQKPEIISIPVGIGNIS